MSDSSQIDDHSKNERQEYVTFLVSDQPYCINIMSLREIRGWSETSQIPDAPECVRGVINLRGTVVPIFDLSERLHKKRLEANSRHVIMVTQVEDRTIGLLADAVSDIIFVEPGDIQPLPELARDASRDFVEGLILRDEQMIRVLSLNALIPEEIRAAA